MDYNFITILGPTAVGKTKLAAQLAAFFDGEIISADSRQVYRRMDIGTGKDYEDYFVNNQQIPYHLIDIIEPNQEYNLFTFIQDFNKIFKVISSANKTPFLVGGTGLYVEAILKNYKLKKAEYSQDRKLELENKSVEELTNHLLSLNPNLHNTTDTLIKKRIIDAILIAESESQKIITPLNNLSPLILGVKSDTKKIREKITKRLKQRLETGMIEEVKNLIEEGISPERLKLFGLEYKFISAFVLGDLNYNDMSQKLNSAIHKFAKRQMTWFRKMERDGFNINWVESGDYETAKAIVEENTFKVYV